MAALDGFAAKLKVVGGKIGDFSDRVLDAGKDLGGKLGGALFDNEFDKIRSLNQLAKQQTEMRKKYTVEELEEAEKKTEAVLATLPQGYFDDKFDPVAYELKQLSDSSNQEEIDCIVERLTAGVETVSGRLSKHVMQKKDQLILGINTVAAVEDDIKAAYLITKTSRSTLKLAQDEVARNMRVAGQTRRKQGYMQLLDACLQIKQAKDLQQTLKRAQEMGEYGEAILTCVQSFQGVDTIKELTVSAELRATVQRLYVDTLRRLDGSLTNTCADFNPDKYIKILEGYLLQGIDGKGLADKVLQCFKESINDVTTRVVRSLLLTKPKLADKLAASSALEASYGELCRALPVDMLRPCLLKLMEVMFDVLSSYHVMAQWHAFAVQKAQMEDVGEDPARAATRNFLSAVHDMMQVSRKEVLEAAARRIQDLLNMENLFKGEDFMQMVEWCQKFAGMAEAFIGGPTELRFQVMAVCRKFLPAFHLSNLDAMTTCLNNEHWQDIGAAVSVSVKELEAAINQSPFWVPDWSSPDAQHHDFETWIMNGNPFRRSLYQSQATGRKSLLDVLHKTQSDERHLSRSASQQSSLSGLSEDNASSVHTAGREEPPPVPSPVSSSQGRAGVSGAPAAESSGRSNSVGGAQPRASSGSSSSGVMLTISSQLALKYMRNYGQLMKPLQSEAQLIFHALSEVFDMYLLCCFFIFSGISLEDLVWRDDQLTHRLKSTLIRILTVEGSRFKNQVEELQRNKPAARAAPIAATGLGLLDRFGDKMESLADTVERNAVRMAMATSSKLQQALGNNERPGGSHPFPDGGGRSANSSSHGGSAHSSSLATVSHSGGSFLGGGRPGSLSAIAERVDAHSTASVLSSGNLFGLQERVVAVESLMHMAEELKAGKAAILAVLPLHQVREAEAYFKSSVESAQDLKDCLFRGAAKLLMQKALDADTGVAAKIAATKYDIKEPSDRQNQWTNDLVKAFSTFRDLLNGAGLPIQLVTQMWEHAVAVASDAILDGLATVRRCTLDGRAMMSFDMSYVDRQIRLMAPQGLQVQLRSVEEYIKAYYRPWDELQNWCQGHASEYGRARLFTLVEVAADYHKVRRQAKNELLERIEGWSAEHH